MAESDRICCDICSSIIDTFNSCIDYVLGLDRSDYEYKKNDDIVMNNDTQEDVRIDVIDLTDNQEIIIENYIG
jgi:hypothetical protein